MPLSLDRGGGTVRPPNINKETGIPRDGRTTCMTRDSEGYFCPESVEGCDGRGCEEGHS